MKTEIEIYEQSFGCDKEFETELFRSPPETLKVNGETVSELFLLPCDIVKGDKKYRANYVFAVATKQTERKKGYMEKLLKRVIADNNILILRPINDDLIPYYEKFGFEIYTATDKDNEDFFINPVDNFKSLADFEGASQGGGFTLMALNSPFDLNGISFKFSMP